MDDKSLRAYMAEMIGTFAFVLISAASAYVATLAGTGPGGGWRQPGLVWVALASGLMYAATLAWTVPISGGYLNPAVTIMLWVFRRLDGLRTCVLIAVQILGAVLAGMIVYFLPSQEPARIASHLGAPHLNLEYLGAVGSSSMAIALKGIAIELALTFLLVLSIFGTQLDPRAARRAGNGVNRLACLWIGLTLVACTFVGFPLTGAALNPARWLGPALWNWTQDPNAFQYHAPYWIGPIVGAVLAGWLYTALILPPEDEQRPVVPAPPSTTRAAAAASTLIRTRK